MTFEEIKKDFSDMTNDLANGKGIDVQIKKIINYLQVKYNKEFIPISYGDRYDKLNDDITILVYPKDDSRVMFKASR